MGPATIVFRRERWRKWKPAINLVSAIQPDLRDWQGGIECRYWLL